MDAVHVVFHILDSLQPNPLFYSPIPDTVQHIIDIGTGSGIWARDVADRYPSAVVQGVDLHPPPETWMPPNCKMEVDDALKPWTWPSQFDLIYLRALLGGYIEQVEGTVSHCCDDGIMPPDSGLAQWGPMFLKAAAKTGKALDTAYTMKSRILAAGFVNLQEKTYKVPIGEWAKNKILKEAGKFNKAQLLEGLEGYATFLLTKFGDPEPWTQKKFKFFWQR